MDLSHRLKEFEERSGMLVVISGPSGVGKGTLLRRLLEVCPKTERCVTYTTRRPRPGEVTGVDYNFVSEEEFRRMIDDGEFLEYAQVHLNLYGTPLSAVNRIREKRFDALLEIDVQGGLTIKGKVPEAVAVFIVPPSMEELERRLRDRRTDTEESIGKRLQNVRKELDCIPMYDYLIVNKDIETAVDELRCIVMAERARIR